MFYNGNNQITDLCGVDHMQWNGGFFDISPRPYSALAFRIRGQAVITVNGHSCRITPHDILYLPQDLSYTAQYSDTDMLVVHFRTVHSDSQPEVYSLSNPEPIHQDFLHMHTLWNRKEPGYRSYILSTLYRILGQICQLETAEKLPPNFTKGVSYMNSMFRNSSVSVGQICRESGISETGFRLLLKKHYQKTPVEYLTELRLDYARNLISCGIPVEQAAVQSGFPDAKYFARTVKKHFGCTPRQLKSFGK